MELGARRKRTSRSEYHPAETARFRSPLLDFALTPDSIQRIENQVPRGSSPVSRVASRFILSLGLFGIALYCALPACAQILSVDRQVALRHFEAGRFAAAESLLTSIWRNDPNDVAVSAQLGLARVALGDLAGSHEAIARADSLDPSILWTRSVILEAEQRYDEALAVLLRLETIPPVRGMDRIALVRRVYSLSLAESIRLRESGDLDRAIRMARRSVTYVPDSLQGHRQLVGLLLESEQWADAVRATMAAGGRFPTDPSFLRARARAQAALSDTEALQATLTMLYAIDPDPVVGLAVAQGMLAGGQTRDAEDLLTALIQRNERYWPARSLLARIYATTLRFVPALKLIQEARTLDPSAVEPVIQMGSLYGGAGEWALARASYDTLATFPGRRFEADQLRLASLMVEGSWSTAATLARRLSEAYPDSVDPATRYAWSLDSLGLAAASRSVYRTVAAMPGVTGAEPWVGMADASWTLNEKSLAADEYRVAIARGTPTPRAWYRVAQTLPGESERCEAFASGLTLALATLRQTATPSGGSEGDPRRVFDDARERHLMNRAQTAAHESIPALDQFCKTTFVESVLGDLERRYTDSPQLANLLAIRELRRGFPKAAQHRLEQTLRLVPLFADGHRTLAEAYLAAGDSARARMAYERALGLQPDHDETFRRMLRLYRETGELDSLIERLRLRLDATRGNDELLRRRLVQALRAAGRMGEAREEATQ